MTQPELEQIGDLRALFLNDTPLLDVRAPVEFNEGAFPRAENHPLIDDHERQLIGIEYKNKGQDAAIALGESLVDGELRTQRIAAWRDFLARHPEAVLYCFRGGKRSQISQQWLHDVAGIHCPRVRGGYKSMRRFLLGELEVNSAHCHPVVIGGRTGVGKTRLLARCAPHIDLEGLARHRGSAFGGHPDPQPSQINFENALSIALLKQVASGNHPFAIEDESRNIGSRHVPEVFFDAMRRAPLILLDASDEERIQITRQEYVDDALAEYRTVFGDDDGFERWASNLNASVDRIKRRLGGERHARVKASLSSALERHRTHNDVAPHADWIACLLREYYDGMYNYQLDGKGERVVFHGRADEVEDYLLDHYAIARASNV